MGFAPGRGVSVVSVADDASAPAALFRELGALHERAGRPAARELAERIGRHRISPQTVEDLINGPRVGSWARVSLVVQVLDGDLETVRALWRRAHDAQADQQSTVDSPVPVDVPPEPPAVRGAMFTAAEFKSWLSGYQPPPPAEEDLNAAVELLAQRLAGLSRDEAVAVLIRLAKPVAAAVVVALPESFGRAMLAALGSPYVDLLIDAARPEHAQRLTALRGVAKPETPSPGTTGEMGVFSLPAVEAVGEIMSRFPNLARDWGWLPKGD
jgi:hypothetical protein